MAPARPSHAVGAERPPRLTASSDADRKRLSAEADALAARWAPAFVQHTSARHPERDRPLRVDFDGDWDATNNWSNLSPAVLEQAPVAYFSAILSETHAFLTYTLFYPRDWIPVVCVSYACHDNDLEVVLVVAERAASSDARAGLVFVESKFHTQYVAESGAGTARLADGRPVLAVESEGHGITPAPAGEALELADAVLLRPAALHAAELTARSEQYLLRPLAQLWERRRPDASGGRLWNAGDLGFLSYTGVRFGRLGDTLGATMSGREFVGGVRPPWGIDPNQNRGDWFLDPAFGALSRHGRYFAQRPASLDYDFNPYVEDLIRECRGHACEVQGNVFESQSLPATFPFTSVGLLLLGLRRRRRPARVTAALTR